MSNVLISPFYKSHPVFRAEQVLSDVHLNDMLRYLEQENNQTRSQLIGTGIVQGFDYEFNGNSIIVNNGKGVSTSGQLIIQDGDSDTLTCSYAIPYQVSKLEKEFPLLAAQLPDLANAVTIHALIPDDLEGGETLSGRTPLADLLGNTKDTGLIAFQESVEIHTESCFVSNCDERGASRKFAIKFLLIQINSGFTPASTHRTSTLKRLDRLTIEHSNAPQLALAWKNACTDTYIDWLVAEVENIRDHLSPVLTEITGAPSLAYSGLHLKVKRDQLFQTSPQFMQYFYDLLLDLGQTIVEVVQEKQQLSHLLHRYTHSYPNHLVLGSITGGNAVFRRSYFQPVIPDEQEQKALKRLYGHCKRLSVMLSTFLIPRNPGSLRIVPTQSRNRSLAMSAIARYYSEHSRHDYWHHGMLHYENPDPALNWFHDDYDNLLIEGLIGKSKNQSLQQLTELQKAHHLPFAIVALRISETDHDEPYPLPEQWQPGMVAHHNFKDFMLEHPGLYHASSVPKGGTLALVFRAEPGFTEGNVEALLVLPYICCGQKQTTKEPEPFVLDAVGDNTQTLTGGSVDIKVLENDLFDPDNPIEVDFVYDLLAKDDQHKTLTGRQTDIHVLSNDQFDPQAPLEIELLTDLNASDVHVDTLTDDSLDIDVLQNDNINTGPIELDFDTEN